MEKYGVQIDDEKIKTASADRDRRCSTCGGPLTYFFATGRKVPRSDQVEAHPTGIPRCQSCGSTQDFEKKSE